MKKGFSLIELSVVLVIIGLLVGVLVAARSLTNATKIQAVVSDFGKYKQAAIQYKEKYYYWPGDFPDAHNTWSATIGYGDGDGKIQGSGTLSSAGSQNVGSNPGSIVVPGETTFAFTELSASGFIAGSYTGNSGGVIPEKNFAKAPIDIISGGTLASPVYYYYYQVLGGVNKNTINITDFINDDGNNPSGAIKPSQALAIDTKIDDGLANNGVVRGVDNSASSSQCTTGNGPYGNGASYDVGNNTTSKCISSFAIE